MDVLIIHNSDEVIDCFVGTQEEILIKVKASKYWEDIIERLDYCMIPEVITLNMIETLYHDGDSEDGYTLFVNK
jgi:hypothetical protein